MNKKEIVIIAEFANEKPISLGELFEICHISTDFVRELIENDIIHPAGNKPDEWKFNMEQLYRIKKAMRLSHDLEINLAGIAVVFDLLDEMERLRTKLKILERHGGGY